jgi:hypothetical protein
MIGVRVAVSRGRRWLRFAKVQRSAQPDAEASNILNLASGRGGTRKVGAEGTTAVTSMAKRFPVALVIEEPDLPVAPGTDWEEVRRSGIPPVRTQPPNGVVSKGLRVLEAWGWRDVQLVSEEWDDHPQFSGHAYYIIASCLLPIEQEAQGFHALLASLPDALQCMIFRPQYCIACNLQEHDTCDAKWEQISSSHRSCHCFCLLPP